MALNPTAPGVYVEEVSTLPSSVVPVPTAIPVFIGYTEQAEIDGEALTFPTNPIRIESLLEYQAIFGGALDETFKVTLTTENVDIAVEDTTNSTNDNDFRLFYNMQMYFANGGGPCYIISVGDYSSPIPAGNPSDLLDAIPLAEQVDEITLIVIPDAMSGAFGNSDRRTLYDAMLAQCAKLKDRFSILDVELVTSNTIVQDSDAFRNNAVGANNLNYGAAYYPPFNAAFGFTYVDTGVTIVATDVRLPNSVEDFDGLSLAVVKNGVKATGGSVTIGATPTFGPTDKLTIGSLPDIALVGFTGTGAAVAEDLADYINATAPYNSAVVATWTAGVTFTLTAIVPGTAGNYTITTNAAAAQIASVAPLTGGITPDGALYSRIKAAITAMPIQLYPSAMMAGIYANVDGTRGVWKAPANVGVASVDSLNRLIKESDQGLMNVDPASGKSIDAIREFPGRGMLVWGARTLDGNSNDFRYVSVRRTLIFLEDSCKHASEFVVFEPNDRNTWIRVKGMISNFLTNIWRQGGLVGEKPEQAFFVKAGLGETMSPQDILEGRLIVLIGVAISHPAEFILLRFEHKLQES